MDQMRPKSQPLETKWHCELLAEHVSCKLHLGYVRCRGVGIDLPRLDGILSDLL